MDGENEEGDEVEVPKMQKSVATDSDIILGASSSTLNDEDMIMQNPHLKKLFNKMLDDRIKKTAVSGETSNSRLLTSLTPPGSKNEQNVQGIVTQQQQQYSSDQYRANLAFNLNRANVVDMGDSMARQEIGLGLTDDDFFHLTCHIDQTLQQKIEKGCYVDLDKLLPKERQLDSTQQFNNETKLEWVQSGGSTYLVPAKRLSRINCFRRWEQAFRMYTTIDCSKHPNRFREILQYISVIIRPQWHTIGKMSIIMI